MWGLCLITVAATLAATASASTSEDKYSTLVVEASTMVAYRTETFPKSRIECGALCTADAAACKAFAYAEAAGGPCELSDGAALVATAEAGLFRVASLKADVISVEGNWENWGEWSGCSCSTENKTRTRTCGTPSYGGSRMCPGAGEAEEVAECGLPPCAYSEQFMALGGYNSLNSVEIVDISSGATTCAAVENFPVSHHHRQATYMEGKVVSCGGYYSGAKTECYAYDFDTGHWTTEPYSLVTATSYLSHTVMLPNNTWMLVGGRSGGMNVNLVKDGVTSAGPTLPETFEYACGATINDTHIFIGGGQSSSVYRRAKILNIPDWEFTTLNDMKYPACGLIENPTNGLEIVAAGGDQSPTTSEILSLATLTWRAGPAVPAGLKRASYAQVGPTFIVAGGSEGSRNIYKFDEANYGWILLDRQLAVERHWFPLIPLPEELGLCS